MTATAIVHSAPTMTCCVCHRTGNFNADGFDFILHAGQLQPACGKCSRAEFADRPLPVRLRTHERRAVR